MSPARKSKRSAKKPAKATKAKAAKAKAKPAKHATPKAAKPKAAPAKRHCAATDPFGDPCQSVPRFGSKHCTIHSYLDR